MVKSLKSNTFEGSSKKKTCKWGITLFALKVTEHINTYNKKSMNIKAGEKKQFKEREP